MKRLYFLAVIMKLGVCLLTVLLVGCSAKQPSSSNIDVPEKESVELPSGGKLEIQVWEEGMALDSENAEPRSLFEKLLGVFTEKDGDFHFRKVRWGYSQAMVQLSEQKLGTRLVLRKENTLVYNERIADVPVDLVYSFEKNRLRAAGYLTQRHPISIKNAKQMLAHITETLGKPNDSISGGMVWADYETLIYCNDYTSLLQQFDSEYAFSPGLLPHQKPRDASAGVKIEMELVWTWIDQNFFRQLHETEDPVSELSFYEKRLADVLRKKALIQCLP